MGPPGGSALETPSCSKLLIIDPWNEIEHDRPPHLTSTEYTGLALRALKRFARKHQIHLIVVAHPKMLRRDQQGEYPFPSLYDIADSTPSEKRYTLSRIKLNQRKGDPKLPIES